MNNNITQKPKLKMPQYIGYAFCEVAGNPMFTVISSFLLLFYTDYIGLPAAACGAVILVSKFLDGISDLIAGYIVEHTHTRSGSARPWILRIGIPMFIAFILLFTVPNVGNAGKILYLFITYNFANTVAFTMLNTAACALPNYMVRDQQERGTLFVVKMIAACILQCVVGFFFMTAVVNLGNDQRAWIILGVAFGAVSFLSTLIVYRLCPERQSDTEESETKIPSIPFLTSIKVLFKNKYWVLTLGIQFTVVLIQICVLTVGGYYASYVLNDVTLSGALIAIFCIPGIPIMFFVPLLMKRFGKRNVALAGAAVMLLSQFMIIFPSSSSMVYTSLLIKGIGFAFSMSTMNGMLADTLEWSEYQSGIRPQAMTMAASGVAQKVGSGLGTGALGLYLTYCGYDIDPASATSVAGITNCFIYVPVIVLILLIIFYLFFDLDKKYDYVVSEISQRQK